MNIEEFFELLQDEIAQNKEIEEYYKFHSNKILYEIRKHYFCNRLQYIKSSLDKFKDKNNLEKKDIKILDCGCGFGSIAIFLSINGYQVDGITIGEHYINGIQKRKDFWSKYGDASKFNAKYEYLPDLKITDHYDIILLQDALHHLEPIDNCIKSLYKILKPEGKLIITEANGANLFHILKHFLRRGKKTIFKVYDKVLCKDILYGDENFKSIRCWKKMFLNNKFMVEKEIEYIKFIPLSFNKKCSEIRATEKLIEKFTPILREYMFFGFNFTVIKCHSEK